MGWLFQSPTALHETDGSFAFYVASNNDLFAIKKRGTGTGKTEFHVLSAATGYQQFSLQTGTALHETDDAFEFAVAENRDVFAFKKRGTGTGKTEIHVLSVASGYQQFSLQTGTALHETDSTFQFALAQNRDVFAIKKSNTGTRSTEVHILEVDQGYGAFSLQRKTALHETDDAFCFGVTSDRDVLAVKRRGTGSNTTEVHIFTAEKVEWCVELRDARTPIASPLERVTVHARTAAEARIAVGSKIEHYVRVGVPLDVQVLEGSCL